RRPVAGPGGRRRVGRGDRVLDPTVLRRRPQVPLALRRGGAGNPVPARGAGGGRRLPPRRLTRQAAAQAVAGRSPSSTRVVTPSAVGRTRMRSGRRVATTPAATASAPTTAGSPATRPAVTVPTASSAPIVTWRDASRAASNRRWNVR